MKPTETTIRITNLTLRTIIGANEWERSKKQEIVINLWIHVNAEKAVQTDDLADTFDYKTAKRNVIALVENSKYKLLEKLAHEVLNVIMVDPRALGATVRVDKPHALRFADSVSVEMSRNKAE